MGTLAALDAAVHGTVVATLATLVVALYNGTLFAWHPILMSLGYIAAMSEGVLSAIKFRRLDGPQRVAAIQLHFYIQLCAVFAAAGGFAAIYKNKVPDAISVVTAIHAIRAGAVNLFIGAGHPWEGALQVHSRQGDLPHQHDSPLLWCVSSTYRPPRLLAVWAGDATAVSGGTARWDRQLQEVGTHSAGSGKPPRTCEVGASKGGLPSLHVDDSVLERRRVQHGLQVSCCTLLQVGVVTWLLALLTVQLALTHPSVDKVSCAMV